MPPVAADLGEPEENSRKYVPRENGCIASFIDDDTKIGAMVELSCVSEFVARSDELRQLAEQIARHIARSNPKFISKEDLAALTDKRERIAGTEACLLEQRLSDEADYTVSEVVARASAEMEDNIAVHRFVRFAADG